LPSGPGNVARRSSTNGPEGSRNVPEGSRNVPAGAPGTFLRALHERS